MVTHITLPLVIVSLSIDPGISHAMFANWSISGFSINFSTCGPPPVLKMACLWVVISDFRFVLMLCQHFLTWITVLCKLNIKKFANYFCFDSAKCKKVIKCKMNGSIFDFVTNTKYLKTN